MAYLNLAPGLTGDGVLRLEECVFVVLLTLLELVVSMLSVLLLLLLMVLLLFLLLLSGSSLIGDNLFGISRVLCCYVMKKIILKL